MRGFLGIGEAEGDTAEVADVHGEYGNAGVERAQEVACGCGFGQDAGVKTFHFAQDDSGSLADGGMDWCGF